jgi:nitrite reductase/ring-hydroxylating ferredoxin subunit
LSDPERFNQALESLLADRSPRQEAAQLDDEEQAMLRMAQLLRGSRSQAPSRQFVDRLHDQLLPSTPRMSRRTAFLSGLGALAAGILAGVGLDRLGKGSSTEHEPLVEPGRGRWMHVANVAEVPSHAVRPFTAGAVQGFLINRGGHYRAFSRICTHMGCTLTFHRSEQSLVCPCHRANFALNGRQLFGPNRYPQVLPRLPEIDVRVQGHSIQVWAA